METKIRDSFLMKFRKKEGTQNNYRCQIDMFYKFISEGKFFKTDEDLLKSVTFDDAEKYFYSIDDKGYKKATINLKIEVIKELFDYAVKREVVKTNPTKTIDKYGLSEIQEDKKEKYIPTLDEIKKIIKSTYLSEAGRRSEEFNNTRDRFLASLLTVTGLRIEEALGIKMEDIDSVDGGYMINIDGARVKNGMNKRVPIPESIIKYFEEYKIQRMIMNDKFNSDLLFFSYRGKKLSVVSANNSWEKFCNRAGVNGKITSHCFRHFLSNYLQSKGYDIGMIYKILGWRENNIITVYSKKAHDKAYDKMKLEICNIVLG